jgi:hypothetical protein
VRTLARTGRARENGTDRETDRGRHAQTGNDQDDDEEDHAHQADGAVLAIQVGLGALLNGRADFLHPRIPSIQPQNPAA